MSKQVVVCVWVMALCLAGLPACGSDSSADPASGAGASAGGGGTGGTGGSELDGGGDSANAAGTGGAASAGAAGVGGAGGAPECDNGYGYPCMQAANWYCQVNGSLECYSISLRTVCGPPGRTCSTAAPSCADSEHTCFGPLIPGDEADDNGICLSEEEMRCFCSQIGAMLRPGFCPPEAVEPAKLGEYCDCDDFCPYDDGAGPCEAELTCVHHKCVGPLCSSDGPDTCPDGMMCTTVLDYDSTTLGEACMPH